VGGAGGNGDGNVKFGAREHRMAVATLGETEPISCFSGLPSVLIFWQPDVETVTGAFRGLGFASLVE
jgi:hypothetical protein